MPSNTCIKPTRHNYNTMFAQPRPQNTHTEDFMHQGHAVRVHVVYLYIEADISYLL
jgi:hypothetical protein